MKEKIITFLILIIAAIHLIPVSGALGAAQLETLYGLTIDSAELDLLLRHRAIMFGLLGCVFILAAFKRSYQNLAFALATGSMLPFFYLYFASDTNSETIRQIALGDGIASLALVCAVLLRYWPDKQTPTHRNGHLGESE